MRSCELRTSRNGQSKYCAVTFDETLPNGTNQCLCWTPDMIQGKDIGQRLKVAVSVSTFNGKSVCYLNSVEVLSPKKTEQKTEEQKTPSETPVTSKPAEQPKTKLNRTAGFGRRIAGMRQTQTEEKPEKSDETPTKEIPTISETEAVENKTEESDEFKNIPIKRWENPAYKNENGFSPLSPNEIKVIPTVVNEDGAKFLLFATALTYERKLNDKFGITGWQRKFKEVGGNVYCSILIQVGENWLEKEAGTDDKAYPDKGRAYDSAFERACRSIGLGDELWTAPEVYIPANRLNISRNDKGGFSVISEVTVNDIEYDEGKNIVRLELKANNKIIFTK